MIESYAEYINMSRQRPGLRIRKQAVSHIIPASMVNIDAVLLPIFWVSSYEVLSTPCLGAPVVMSDSSRAVSE